MSVGQMLKDLVGIFLHRFTRCKGRLKPLSTVLLGPFHSL